MARANATALTPRSTGGHADGGAVFGKITILEHSGQRATYFSMRDPCGRCSLIRADLAILSRIAPHQGQLTRMRGFGIG